MLLFLLLNDEEVCIINKDKIVYNGCLKWLRQNYRFFDPRRETNLADKDLQIKAFTELIFIYNMFMPNQNVFPPKFAEEIKVFIDEILKDMDMKNYVLFDKGYFPLLAIVEEFKNYNNQVRSNSFIEDIIDKKFDILVRRIPYRKLDLKYSLDKAQFVSNLDEVDKIYQETILGKNFNYMYITDYLAYSVTHTLFYMTDMGRFDFFQNRDKNLNILKNLFFYYSLKNNMDILAEIILCILFLGGEKERDTLNLINDSMYIIQQNQRKEGYILAPGAQPVKNNEQQFFENYHTTLVAFGGSYEYRRKINKASF